MTGSPDPGATDVADDPELRAARRTAALIVIAVVALAIALVATLLIRQSSDDEPSGVVAPASGAPVGGGGGGAGDVGPAPGAAVDAYVTARRDALAAVADDTERVAVVSFTRYRTAAEASRVLDDAGLTSVVTVLGRLVAAPGGDPVVVTGELAEWAAAASAAAEADRAEVERILPTVEPGSEFVAFYERELVRLAAVRDGATADGAVVFGLVVRARGATMRALAARAAVRLVDVAPSADAPPATALAGLLPDDVTTVGTPPQRPVPTK